MAQNPDLLNNEDFETVDHDLYQDENVTSTSLTGEMAEEDRYQGDHGDLLGDEYTSTAGQPAAYQEEPEQLISFDSSPPPAQPMPAQPTPAPVPETTVTEPTPPPVSIAKVEPFPEPAAVTGGLMAIPGFEAMGAWLENVDPRDDSAKVAESKDDMMASPVNPDVFEKPGASSGAEQEVGGEIRHFIETERLLKEIENDSESDSSMSVDGSSESNDSAVSDSESDSEVSVSDTEENKIDKNKIEFLDRNEAGVLSAAEGKEILSAENGASAASAEIIKIGSNDAMNEYILNKDPGDDIIAAINEEVNNAYLAEQQQEEIRSKYFEDMSKQLGLAFQNVEESSPQIMDNEENVSESQIYTDDAEIEASGLIEQKEREMYGEEALNTGKDLISDGSLYPPYYEDGKDEVSGSVQALEKQTETTYEGEDTLLLSDISGNSLLYTDPSINVPRLNLHEVGNNALVTEADTQFAVSYDPDMMEKLRLGILKNDSRVSDEFGSDHSSDVERGSNHSEEHHVRFKDEVVVMEFSDEDKEQQKTDKIEKCEEWISSENEGKDTFVEKDSVESMESKENMMLAMGYNESIVDRSGLDLNFYRIGQAEDKSSLENNGNLDQKTEQVPVPSFYSVPKSADTLAVDEKEQTSLLLEKDENLNIDSGNYNKIDMNDERVELQSEKIHDDISVSSESDSDEKRSDEESASDSSSDVNVSGEWNVSPLCDMEQNDTVSGIVADIPESVDTSEESVSSDNICLLNYAPVGDDMNKSERSDAFEEEQSEVITNVSDTMEEIADEYGIVHEGVPMNNELDRVLDSVDRKTETTDLEINSEAVDVLDVEEQLKEVEITAKLMAEATETPEAVESYEEHKDEQIDVEEAGVKLSQTSMPIGHPEEEIIFDDEAKDYRTEKNQGIVEEAVTLLDNVEKELEHSIEDIDHTPQLRKDSGSVELTVNQEGIENIIISEECLENPVTDRLTDVVAENMTKNIENITQNDPSKLFETLEDISGVTDNKDNVDVELETKSFRILSVDNPVWQESESVENSKKIEPVVGINVQNLEKDITEGSSVAGWEEGSDVGGSDLMATSKDGDVRADPGGILSPSSRITEFVVQVVDLIYWRDVKRTGIVFGSMMFVLMALACFSLMSVLAYLSLAVLTVTFSFRLYKSIMQAVQKTNEGHPFKKLMEMNIELKDEVVQEAAENIAKHINNCHRELRRLYLVEDYVDSIKFGMLLWLLTYVGSWFSGMTLIILVVVSIFTLPRVYETYKVQIDTYINMARAQLNKILAQISAKIPFPKKKTKTQ